MLAANDHMLLESLSLTVSVAIIGLHTTLTLYCSIYTVRAHRPGVSLQPRQASSNALSSPQVVKLPQSSAGGKVSSSRATVAPRLPQRGRKKELPPWCDFTACPAGLSPKCQSSFFKRFVFWTGPKKLSDTEELSVSFSASSSRVSV